MTYVSREIAEKVLRTVNAGLVAGAGFPEPGYMCVEAAVCYAYGKPHGDRPPCVGAVVRAFKIGLNDAWWPSSMSRANGMRAIAIAQLGSADIDQYEFVDLILIATVKRLLSKYFQSYNKELAGMCASVTTRAGAEEALSAVYQYRQSILYRRPDVRQSIPASTIRNVLNGALSPEQRSAAIISLIDELYESDMQDMEYLLIASDICLQALIELKSPGVEYLFLLDNT